MKSDRRHELQTNVLADWLGEHLESLRPHAMPITLVAIAIVVLGLGSIWYFGSEDQTAAEAWKTYFGAFNQREPGKVLEQLADEKTSATAALWARQSIGDMNLAEGARLLFSDRTEAQKLLLKAEAAFRQVEASATEPMLKSRARLGLGKVNEAMCKPQEAEKYYAQVAESDKHSAIGMLAAKDAKRMKDQREVALLAWFDKQQPKKPAPLPGAGGGLPGLPSDLPERPDISPPSGLGLDKLGTGLPAEPAPAFPAPATTPPPATPEAAKPDATKPEDAKPADVKPEGAKPDAAPSAAATTPEAPKPAAGDAEKKLPE